MKLLDAPEKSRNILCPLTLKVYALLQHNIVTGDVKNPYMEPAIIGNC